jgi:ABC-2 type transport system ATP-binding protein
MLAPGAMPLERARDIDGVDDVRDDGVTMTISTRNPSPVLAALAAANVLDGLQVRSATLEDVFLQLTGRAYRA